MLLFLGSPDLKSELWRLTQCDSYERLITHG
jgi:hypothetical protein